MGQARLGGGLLVALALGFWIGCAGAGDPLANSQDPDGGADADPPAMEAGPDGPTYSPLCYNHDKDPGETDFDCGGNCPPCALGLSCIVKADCAKGDCVSFICTAPSSCSDGRRDNKETDVDCGGPDCATCASGKKCTTGTDCTSKTCTSGTCA
jgi:hypothetical protein